jgi:ribosomal protein L11 methyltransferase
MLVSPARKGAVGFSPRGQGQGRCKIEGWFKDARLKPALLAQAGLLGGANATVVSEVPRDWLRESKASFPMQRLGRFCILPAWRHDKVPKGCLPIRLLQGQAFGTGLHASTQLMLAALERQAGLKGTALLDVGAGSGILGFAALHLGALCVDNVELEQGACDEMAANRAENGVAKERFKVFCGAYPKVAGLQRRYPLVLANLTTPVLEALMPALARRLARGGALLMSGIHRKSESLRVMESAQAQGLKILLTRHRGLWWQISAQRAAA